MQNQLFSLYRGIFLFNSTFQVLLGFWLIYDPSFLTNAIEHYSKFNWEEFVFNEPMVGFYIKGIVRLLGAILICIGIGGGLIIFRSLKLDNIGYKNWVWWSILAIQILPYTALISFKIYTSLLGAVEMIEIVIWMLTVMAWWRLRK